MKKILLVQNSICRSTDACVETVAEMLIKHGVNLSMLTEYDDRSVGRAERENSHGVRITRCHNWEREWFRGLRLAKQSEPVQASP